MASLTNPEYTVTIVAADGTKYYVTPALEDLVLTENEKELAEKVTLRVKNVNAGGKWMSVAVNVRDRVYIYANTGAKKDEVFRGRVWSKTYQKGVEKDISIVCYDNLIYLQESEESYFFSKGKTTKSVFSTICKKKGISLTYSHSSMKHPKLVLRGTLGDILTNDLLDEVRKKTGKRGVIRSEKGKMKVVTIGKGNSTVYKLTNGEGGNIISSEHSTTMDNMVTKVAILGKETKSGKVPVKTTIKGNTSKYGTLKKIISAGDNLSDAKKEAKQTIKDRGKPTTTRTIQAIDNPWIRKGDKVNVDDDYLHGADCAVMSISHDAKNKTMTLEVKKL